MRSLGISSLLCCCLLLGQSPADAQLGDLLKGFKLPGTGAVDGRSQAGDVGIATAPAVGPLKDVSSELAPDTGCTRPRERFNVGEKLSEYGGSAASLRFQRLMQSDFRYSELTEQDHQMLRYLAQTTVWLPAAAEAKLGSIYDGAKGMFGPRGDDLNELDRAALDDIEQRLNRMRAVISEYPAEIRLRVDKSLPDGAFARFGGVILLSERFLNGLVEAGIGSDFLLAHELTHIYKRHAMKDVQFKLISSAEGWDLARALLQRAYRGMEINPIADGVFLFTTMPKLIEFVRSVQLGFGRDQELEADACSTVWLKAAGSEPIEAWEKYHATLGANTSYSKEHPSNEEREARFKRRAAGVPDPSPKKGADKGAVKEGGKRLSESDRKKPNRP